MDHPKNEQELSVQLSQGDAPGKDVPGPPQQTLQADASSFKPIMLQGAIMFNEEVYVKISEYRDISLSRGQAISLPPAMLIGNEVWVKITDIQKKPTTVQPMSQAPIVPLQQAAFQQAQTQPIPSFQPMHTPHPQAETYPGPGYYPGSGYVSQPILSASPSYYSQITPNAPSYFPTPQPLQQQQQYQQQQQQQQSQSYQEVRAAAFLLPACDKRLDCQDLSPEHRIQFSHPCRYGLACRFWQRCDAEHCKRYTHAPRSAMTPKMGGRGTATPSSGSEEQSS